MQDVPRKSRSWRVDDGGCSNEMHVVPFGCENGSPRDSKARGRSQGKSGNRLGASVPSTRIRQVQPSSACRGWKYLPGVPRSSRRTRCLKSRGGHIDGGLHGLPSGKKSQYRLHLLPRTTAKLNCHVRRVSCCGRALPGETQVAGLCYDVPPGYGITAPEFVGKLCPNDWSDDGIRSIIGRLTTQ